VFKARGEAYSPLMEYQGAHPSDAPSERWLVRPKRRRNRANSVASSSISRPKIRLKLSTNPEGTPLPVAPVAPSMQRESYMASSPSASPRPTKLTLPSVDARFSLPEPEPTNVMQPDASSSDGHVCGLCGEEKGLTACSGCSDHYCSAFCAERDHENLGRSCNSLSEHAGRPGLVEIETPHTGGKDPVCGNCSRTKSRIGMPLLHCERCRKMHYCTDSCAQKGWKWHRLSCKTNVGHLVDATATEVKPQKTTHRGRPKVAECANCNDQHHVSGGPLGFCPFCQKVRYCSDECEEEDREWHSTICLPHEDVGKDIRIAELQNSISLKQQDLDQIFLTEEMDVSSMSPGPGIEPSYTPSSAINRRAVGLRSLIEQAHRELDDADFASTDTESSHTPSSPTTNSSSQSSPKRKFRARLPPPITHHHLLKVLAHQPSQPHLRSLSYLTSTQPLSYIAGPTLLGSIWTPALRVY
jgi:hypothetical protein